MAHIGRKKTIKHKRMTEFSPKRKSLVSQADAKIKHERENLIHSVQRGVSKLATKEQLKKGYQKAKKIITSKEAKSVGKSIGGFLRGWAQASREAAERNRRR